MNHASSFAYRLTGIYEVDLQGILIDFDENPITSPDITLDEDQHNTFTVQTEGRYMVSYALNINLEDTTIATVLQINGENYDPSLIDPPADFDMVYYTRTIIIDLPENTTISLKVIGESNEIRLQGGGASLGIAKLSE